MNVLHCFIYLFITFYRSTLAVSQNDSKILPDICNQTYFNQRMRDGRKPSYLYTERVRKTCGKLYPKCSIGDAYPYQTISSSFRGITVGAFGLNIKNIAIGCWGYYLKATIISQKKIVFSKYYSYQSQQVEEFTRDVINFTDELNHQTLHVELTEFPSGESSSIERLLPKNDCEREAILKASEFYWANLAGTNCYNYHSDENLHAVAASYCSYFKNPDRDIVNSSMSKSLILTEPHCALVFKAPDSTHAGPDPSASDSYRLVEAIIIVITCVVVVVFLSVVVYLMRKRCRRGKQEEIMNLVTSKE